jgi:uncharacterized protein (TIGR03084 family)
MSDEYRDLIDDLAAEHADLDALVTPLSDEHWSLLTPAEGWTVRDTLLHLALTDDVAALAATDPPAFEAYRQARRSGADAFEVHRRTPGAELLQLWRANRERLLDGLRGLHPKARITWFGPPMSAMSHATARLMETWAHGQDIADTLGLDRDPSERLKHVAHLGVRTRGYSYSQHGEPVRCALLDEILAERRALLPVGSHDVGSRRTTLASLLEHFGRSEAG